LILQNTYHRCNQPEKSILGPNHPDAANTLKSLAALYRATNRDTEAEPTKQRAARIRAIKRVKAALMIFFA
jgi:hypothetical protein